jgi:integrase
MASIEKRGKCWRAKIRRTGFPSQSRSFDTKALAEIWVRSVESEMDRGIFIDRTEAEKNLVGDLIGRYIREVTPTKRSNESERLRLLAMKKRPIAMIKLAALNGTHIAAYRDDRIKEVSGSTVNKELNLLAHIVETGRKEWGIHIPENPVRMVRRPKSAPARDRRLNGDEEKHLREAIEHARNPYLLHVVELAIETTMRQSEIVYLEWKHIQLDKRVAHLPNTKNGDARDVPLSTKAVRTLKSLGPTPERRRGRVFPGLTSEAIKQAFARSCERAEILDFRFHDLRHEGTSRLFEDKGLNIMEVASVTGHKTLQMLKRYTHLRAQNLAKKLK